MLLEVGVWHGMFPCYPETQILQWVGRYPRLGHIGSPSCRSECSDHILNLFVPSNVVTCLWKCSCTHSQRYHPLHAISMGQYSLTTNHVSCFSDFRAGNIFPKPLPRMWSAWIEHVLKHMSYENKLGCLGYIGDYTTHLCGDYNEPK